MNLNEVNDPTRSPDCEYVVCENCGKEIERHKAIDAGNLIICEGCIGLIDLQKEADRLLRNHPYFITHFRIKHDPKNMTIADCKTVIDFINDNIV